MNPNTEHSFVCSLFKIITTLTAIDGYQSAICQVFAPIVDVWPRVPYLKSANAYYFVICGSVKSIFIEHRFTVDLSAIRQNGCRISRVTNLRYWVVYSDTLRLTEYKSWLCKKTGNLVFEFRTFSRTSKTI